MSNVSFDNLMAKIRECEKDLQVVSDSFSGALNARTGQGGVELEFRVAETDIIRLRSTVDTITRQLLYRTWSSGFKAKIDDSMRHGNWLFPGS